MKKHLVILVAGWAIVSCTGICFAQMYTPAMREASCARQARAHRFSGAKLAAFMAQCTHPKPKPAATPPARPPSSSPPPRPAAGAGKSVPPRQAVCSQAVAEEGLTGTAAQDYMQRCLSAK